MRSFILGLLFVFFAFPLIGRLLFFLFLVMLPLLLAAVAGFSAKKQDKQEDEDIIDVKYKIIE